MAFWTTTLAGGVGQRIKAGLFNLAVTAIQELQAEVFGVPFLHVTNSAAVTNGSDYPYNAVVADSHSGWNAGTKVYTVPKTGMYLAICAVQPSTAVGVAPNIRVNGSTVIAGGYVTNIASGSGSVQGVMSLGAGNTVTVREAGSNYTPANAVTNYLQLKYLGPS